MGALCIFLLVACYYDYRYRKIPNILIILMLIVAVLNRFWKPEKEIFFLASIIIMVAVMLYPFFKIGALGAGDVKLFSVCAAYLSWDRVLSFLFISLLVAVGISLIILITKKCTKEYGKMKIPLAGPILCSVLLYIGGVY